MTEPVEEWGRGKKAADLDKEFEESTALQILEDDTAKINSLEIISQIDQLQ